MGHCAGMTPTGLTARYVDAFNRRDPDYLPLLATDIHAEAWRSQVEGDTVFIETRLTERRPMVSPMPSKGLFVSSGPRGCWSSTEATSTSPSSTVTERHSINS